LNRAVLLLREAADDLRDYLAILDLAPEHRGADDPAARLRAPSPGDLRIFHCRLRCRRATYSGCSHPHCPSAQRTV
jgi:hypothetical protein